ncbi:MAG: activator of HSP90 ATPase [Bacteroidia bacterium]|jgi:activator of HSP90 ATPase
MATLITLNEQFSVSATKLYNAWLNSEEHAKMTGGEAECSDVVGGLFSVWDGYITGKNLSLVVDSEIVQTWRSTEFKDSDADSKLTVRFKNNQEGCELTLIHQNIPDDQPDYEKGWEDHYFVPMREYFRDS